jgi:hypothetical protein
MCADMMAQIQTRIKDSAMRLILPSNTQAQNKNPRRYSAADNALLETSVKPNVEIFELSGKTQPDEGSLAEGIE